MDNPLGAGGRAGWGDGELRAGVHHSARTCWSWGRRPARAFAAILGLPVRRARARFISRPADPRKRETSWLAKEVCGAEPPLFINVEGKREQPSSGEVSGS